LRLDFDVVAELRAATMVTLPEHVAMLPQMTAGSAVQYTPFIHCVSYEREKRNVVAKQQIHCLRKQNKNWHEIGQSQSLLPLHSSADTAAGNYHLCDSIYVPRLLRF
jgi:hypothetical protein